MGCDNLMAKAVILGSAILALAILWSTEIYTSAITEILTTQCGG